MSNSDFDREIEEGLARADKMLKRQRLIIISLCIILAGVIAFATFFGISTYQQKTAKQAATMRPILTATAKANQTATSIQGTQLANAKATADIHTATALKSLYSLSTALQNKQATHYANVAATSTAEEKATQQGSHPAQLGANPTPTQTKLLPSKYDSFGANGKIVFEQNNKLYSFDLSNGVIEYLTDELSKDFERFFRVDSNVIGASSHYSLYTFDLESKQTSVIDVPYRLVSDVSSSNKIIMEVSSNNGHDNLQTGIISNGKISNIIKITGDMITYCISWHPDQEKVVITYKTLTDGKIMATNPILGILWTGADAPIPLYHYISWGACPQWSSDGKSIFFEDENKLLRIWVASSSIQTILEDYSGSFVIAPDDQWVAYSNSEGIFLLNLSNQKTHKIISEQATPLVWLP